MLRCLRAILGPGLVVLLVAGGSAGAARDLSYYNGVAAWSPSGQLIAFGSKRPYYSSGLWLMRPDGTKERQLTKAREWSPAWSPDGKRIAFSVCSSGPGGCSAAVGVVNANGSSRRLLHEDVGEPSWSPDGQRLAVGYLVTLSNTAVAVINSDGTGLTQISALGGGSPSWSSTNEIAYTVSNGSGYDIHAMNPDGSGDHLLVPDGVEPKWSPSGAKIAFVRGWSPRPRIFVANSNGTGVMQLTSGSSTSLDTEPAWSPDGSRVAFTRCMNNPPFGCSSTGIYTVNADGTGIRRLTPLDAPFPCVVPRVVGKPLPAAINTIYLGRCRPGRVGKKHSSVRRGRVISQRPRPGVRLPIRSRVSLVVSLGR